MGPESSCTRIGVFGDEPIGTYRFLFEALAQLLPVEFCWRATLDTDDLAALIILSGDIAGALTIAQKGIPSFVFLSKTITDAASNLWTVSFGNSEWIDRSLHGRTLSENRATAGNQIPLRESDEILASTSDGPVWVARKTDGKDCLITVGAPPVLSERDCLSTFLNGRDFMRVLPLICFLRNLTANSRWDAPVRPACFVFDDPSFYWRSYGFINYRELAAHALQFNYSVSVATIPLDTWWVSSGVAATLRANFPRLSVMIHGNNHTKREMLAHRNGESHLGLAAQSLRRMEQLERRHGISFSRVMEPPHGALACSILPCLLALGYEGALCTTELLLKHNPSTPLPAAIGLKPAEMLWGGLPVLPRIKMSPAWKNDVLLAAFLRQPIILAGHHQDAAEDLKLLAEFAALVNSLGNVAWSDLAGILRTNYEHQRNDDTLWVRLYSRQVSIRIPSGIRHLKVLRTWIPSGLTEKLVIARAGHATRRLHCGPTSEVLAVTEDESIMISSELDSPVHFSGIADLSTSPWLVARKFTMEIRDRLTPLFPFVDKLRRQSDHEAQ